MLTKAYATTVLANAISNCYLEGNNRKALPEGTNQSTIRSTIMKLTFTSNYTKVLFSLLVDACEDDLNFDQYVLTVFNCESIDKSSYTHTSAAEYLRYRGIIR